LRRSETLAVAGKLASGIAHEVGTPLNIISGRAEMVLASLPQDHPGREDLERIINQIDRVSNIVRSLLDAVWVGKLEIQRVPVGMLIGRLLPLLEHVVRKRGIAMTTSIPETLPDVAGDPLARRMDAARGCPCWSGALSWHWHRRRRRAWSSTPSTMCATSRPASTCRVSSTSDGEDFRSGGLG